MAHEAPLITAIVIGLCLAFVFGAAANKLRISPLVGYLLAGVLAGPNTPGFQADSNLVHQLAEIGVILLMFGVGLHFSLKDLLSVRKIAVPGAIAQMSCATLLGLLFGLSQGWSIANGLVFGLALSTASTVVLLRALQEKSLLETERGRIAVGWLVVEDMAMVLLLVLLPVFAGKSAGTHAAHAARGAAHIAGDGAWLSAWLGIKHGWAGPLLAVFAKIALFIAVMLLAGRRLIPKILKMAAQTGSRELFSLSVLAIALGAAYGSAQLFGVSLALGAFFAGMIMSESDLSQRAAEETLPLRDAFAVLFFVSVGMLFQPAKLAQELMPLLAVLAIIFIGNSLSAFALMRLFRQPLSSALTLFAGLAQIGEFSFILAGFGNGLGLINNDARDVIIAGAILSILLNPLVFAATEKFSQSRQKQTADSAAPQAEAPAAACAKTQHSIIVGYGETGQIIAQSLAAENLPCLIVENAPRRVEKARQDGYETLMGNAAHEDMLALANASKAENLILTMGNAYEAAHIAALARESNAALHIVARVRRRADKTQFAQNDMANIVAGSCETAAAMLALVPRGKNSETEAELAAKQSDAAFRQSPLLPAAAL